MLLGVMVLAVQVHYLVPDSAGYLAYARSVLWDRDLDFENDYARFGMIERDPGIKFGAATATGRPGNPFGLGAPLIWLPFVAVTACLAWVASLAGVPVATDGFGTATLWAAQLGTWSCAIGTALLLARILGDLHPEAPVRERRAALTGALLGTPFVYYVLQMPTYSHVCSAFVVTLLTWLSVRWRARWTLRRALLLGAVLGLAGLVRNQELAFGLVPVIVGWWGGALRSRPALVLALMGSAAVVFAPQLLVWASIYGSPWQLPQGSGFLQWSVVRLGKVLLATRHGLLTWSPIVIPAVAGWVVLLRGREHRGLAIAALLAFAAQWMINSLPFDWWAGWSFGARRFTDCTALFGVGLFALLRGRPRRAIAVYALVGANLVQWLRVSSDRIAGGADPGWSELWGSGFVASLAQIPMALWEVIRVPWTSVRILRRPFAVPPSLRDDPEPFLLFLLLLWAAGVLWAVHRYANPGRPPHKA